jgi:hypothetical protein
VNSPTAEPPNHPRRRFQFRLRTLLIGVTLLFLAISYVGWQAWTVVGRMAVLKQLDALGAHYSAIRGGDLPAGMRGPNWIRRILGDVAVVEIDFHESTWSPEALKARFPEADCHVVPEGEKVLPRGPD